METPEIRKAWSLDEENYSEDFEATCQQLFEIPPFIIGEIRELEQGIVISYKASEFLTDIDTQFENMQENAFEQAGEFSDGFLHVKTQDQIDELRDRIAETVDLWASNHNLHPGFFTVDQVETIRVEWIGDNDYLIVP